jgi:hypothetical protein
MRDIVVAREVNPARLLEELKASLDDALVIGVSYNGRQATVHLDDAATDADKETARAIATAHDHTRLSSAEQTEADETARKEAARAQVNAADVTALARVAEAAVTVEELRAQVAALARLVGDLAVAQGCTPRVEEA